MILYLPCLFSLSVSSSCWLFSTACADDKNASATRHQSRAHTVITFINVPVSYLHADHILIRGVSAAFLPLSHPALLFLSSGLDRSPCRPAIKGHSAQRHKLQSTVSVSVSPSPAETHLNNQIIFFCILLFMTDVLQWQGENTFMFQQLQDRAGQRHYFQQALSGPL